MTEKANEKTLNLKKIHKADTRKATTGKGGREGKDSNRHGALTLQDESPGDLPHSHVNTLSTAEPHAANG